MSVPLNSVKELLSQGFIRLVAARSGLVTGTSALDFGEDLQLRYVEPDSDGRYREIGLAIGLQLKATTESQVVVRRKDLTYRLGAKNYNDMVARVRGGHMIPLYLVLVVLPDDETRWLSFAESEVTFRRCAYLWRPPVDARPTRNRRSVSVAIPLANRMEATTLDRVVAGLRA